MNYNDELKKCKDSIDYFVKNYYYYLNIDCGYTKLKPYPYQSVVLEYMKKIPYGNDSLLIASPRQMGKTLLNIAYLIHTVLFNTDKKIIYKTNKAFTADSIFFKFIKSYEQLPDWMKKEITIVGNKNIFRVGTNEVIITGDKKYLKNKSYHIGVFDECDYDEEDSNINKIIISSTRFVSIKIFKKMGRRLHTMKLNFWEHPWHDLEWKDEVQKDIGDDNFEREFECGWCFEEEIDWIVG